MIRMKSTNRNWLTTGAVIICAACVAVAVLLATGSARGEESYVVPAADRPFADAGFAAFQRASTPSDSLPPRIRDEIQASSERGHLGRLALSFASTRRLTSDVAGTSAVVYLIPGQSADADACTVQMIGPGYTYGCGPQGSVLDTTRLRANLVSLGKSGLWRYWGVAPQQARQINLVLEGGAKLAATIEGDVFGVETSEQPQSIEWTDSAGELHQGELSLPPAPPSK